MSFSQYRKYTLCVYSTLLLLVGHEQLSADQSGDFTYEIADGKATITDYPEGATGAVVIPNQLGGVPVTYIADEAFKNCSSITSVTIPSSVDTIGRSAFFYCDSLTSVTIPVGVTVIGYRAFYSCGNLASMTIPSGVVGIGDEAFSGCTSLASVTIPSGVTYLGEGAFQSCWDLTSVTIPIGVTTIGDYTFNDCNSMTSVTIPSGVTSIGDYAFNQCSSLTSITIPSSVTSIGNQALDDCSSLTAITVTAGNTNYSSLDGVLFNVAQTTLIQYPMAKTGGYSIPSGVTSISDKAFYRCSSLTSVTIPSSVISIGSSAFVSCSSLTSAEIPSGVTSVGDYTFYGCISLTSVTLPSSVTSIGSVAFASCISLTSVTLPSGVTSIGDYAFYSCSSLTVTKFLGDAPTTLGSYVFDGVNPNHIIQYLPTSAGFTSPLWNGYATAGFSYEIIGETVKITSYPTDVVGAVVIPESIAGKPVTSIGDSAFAGCINMTSVTIPSGVISIGDSAFQGSSSLTLTKFLGDAPVTFGVDVFDGVDANHIIHYLPTSSGFASPTWNGYAAEVEAPSFSFEVIGNEVRITDYPTTATGRVVIPQTIEGKAVTSIGLAAFKGCSNLTSVTIPSGVLSIGEDAFQLCSSLTSVAIPSSVTSIGSSAFSWCSSLTSVTIPIGVTSISNYAFSQCSSLGSVTIPSNVASFGVGVFSGCSSLNEITVAAGNSHYSSLDGVLFNKAQTVLIQFPSGKSGGYTIPSGVINIGNLAFQLCSSLTSVAIPSSVTSIGSSAFQLCSSLSSVAIPSGVTSIGEGAFAGCSSLTSVTIPNGVTSIGVQTFSDCTSLTEIAVAAGNSHYSSLDGVLFNKAQTALIRCPSGRVGEYTIPSYVTTIGLLAFQACSSLTNLTLPTGVTSIGASAFSNCSSLASVNIPSGVTSIGAAAFSGCSSLASVTIPNGVTNIEFALFSRCTRLRSVTLPSGVTSVGSFAFQQCISLVSTHFTGNAPATFGSNVFQGVDASHLIYYNDTSTGFTSPTWNGYPTQMIDTAAYPFAGWLLESNLSYDVSINQDLNGDGVSLLMAYALGLNPNERLTNHLPKAELDSTTLSLTYYSGSTGVVYRVESSKDLKTWVPVPPSTPDANGLRTASIPRDELCGFLRLVVVED